MGWDRLDGSFGRSVKAHVIRYTATERISAEQFIDLLHRAGFADRRPVDDRACIENMVGNANLTVTA